MDEKDPLEDLVNIVKILMEEPDKLSLLQKQGAKTVRNFFIFTCLGGCNLTYAINYIDHTVYLLNRIDSIPETGTLVTEEEEFTCIIESLLDFVKNALDIENWAFMDRINPNKYRPGSCFAPC